MFVKCFEYCLNFLSLLTCLAGKNDMKVLFISNVNPFSKYRENTCEAKIL